MNWTPPHLGRSELRPLLLVEDNDMDLDLCLQAFAEHGVTNPVTVCRDGEEAMHFIDAHGAATDPALPLLVLLDIRLPKADGLTVLRHARADPVWKRVPIVILTTSREDRDIAAAYDLGSNSYIVKPVDFASFAEVVQRLRMYWILTNEPPFAAPVQ